MQTSKKYLEAVARPGEYLCETCGRSFKFEQGDLACPKCGTFDLEKLVPVYVDDQPIEDVLRLEEDWAPGD